MAGQIEFKSCNILVLPTALFVN